MALSIERTVSGLLMPKRIDAYLADVFGAEFSREQIKRCVLSGTILLNAKTAKPRDVVKEGDRISGELISDKAVRAEGESIPVSVIYEDDSLLVVDKPAGLVVHPGAGHKTGTLVNALLGRKTALSSIGGAFRPGIVHRLDKDTSGLLLVAKNDTAHRKLQAQFAARSLSKTYVALVRGRPNFEEGHMDAPIGHDPRERQKMNVVRGEKGREALTYYKVTRRFKHAALMELKLVTGRTHQIRVHLKHLGNSVIGDVLYGNPNERTEPRLALHAAKIEFVHPKTGKIMKFESAIPAEMKAMIEKAEKS